MQGGAKEYNALTRNLRNIEDKHADQPADNHATLYRIHVLLLLNGRGWKRLNFKNVCVSNVFPAVLQRTLCNESVDFEVLKRAHFTFMHT